MIAEQYAKAEDRLSAERGIFHLLVLDEQPDYRGKLSASDILRVVASDEKMRADLLESFLFTPGWKCHNNLLTSTRSSQVAST